MSEPGFDYQADAPACKFAISDDMLTQRRGTTLCIESGIVHTRRCALRSPDGLGLRYLLSGGSATAYGPCLAHCCPRVHAGGQPVRYRPEQDQWGLTPTETA